jgi:hypothetical protein
MKRYCIRIPVKGVVQGKHSWDNVCMSLVMQMPHHHKESKCNSQNKIGHAGIDVSAIIVMHDSECL